MLCAKYGFDSDPGQDKWGYEPPVRPCDCSRFAEVRRDALDAAREAVAKCDHYYCDDQWSGSQHISMSDALTAIDALRQPPLPTAHYDPAAKDNRP